MEQLPESSDEPPQSTETGEKHGPHINLTAGEISLLLQLTEISAITDHHKKKAERDRLLSLEHPTRTIHNIMWHAEGIRSKLNGSLENNPPLRKLVDGIRRQAALEIEARQTNFG